MSSFGECSKPFDEYRNAFFGDLKIVKDVLKEINIFISSAFPNMSCDILNEIRLIFSELLCNAVIHGNKKDCAKKVFVSITISDGYIYGTVTDEGNGFDYINLLNVAKDGNLVDENGRGIWLVYALSDTLSFNGAGNEIRFVKKVI